MPKYFSLSGNSNKDHDSLSKVAKNDIELFEEIRQKIIDEFFSSVPEEKLERLTRVQWKIDQIRQLSKNPIDASLKISSLMWESINQLNEEQQKLLLFTDNLHNSESIEIPPPQSATILHFRPKKAK